MATQVLHTATTNTIKQGQFLEVWGDTVDSVHLAWAIVIGCVISLSAFLLASRALMAIVESRRWHVPTPCWSVSPIA